MGYVANTEVTGNMQFTGAIVDCFKRFRDFDYTCSGSASQIDDFTIGSRLFDRPYHGCGDICDVDEVTTFLTILKDIDILIVQ